MSKPNQILLVEDNPADVRLTRLALNQVLKGAEIVTLSDGKALLDYLADTHIPFISFIILDLNMPKMGGIDVLKHFRKHQTYKKLPVIVFTSSVHYEDVQTCYDLGANAYVRKPSDILDYCSTIERMASFWLNLNVLPEN